MSRIIQAVFENGLFRPLEAVPFAEHDRVSLVVTSANCPLADQQPRPEPAGNEWDADLNVLLFDGPSLPADFSRADIYADRD